MTNFAVVQDGPKIKLQALVHIFTKNWWILQINISQHSVATQLRFGSMLSNHFITNFQQNVPVKKVNRSIFGKDIDRSLWLTVLGHPVG